jgi:hypothetical protein
MSLNTRLRRLLEVSTALMLLLFLATALALRAPAPESAAVDNPVTLHIRALVYHCPACDLIRHCGADCVMVDVAEARRRGARPCTTCGGICLARRPDE